LRYKTSQALLEDSVEEFFRGERYIAISDVSIDIFRITIFFSKTLFTTD